MPCRARLSAWRCRCPSWRCCWPSSTSVVVGSGNIECCPTHTFPDDVRDGGKQSLFRFVHRFPPGSLRPMVSSRRAALFNVLAHIFSHTQGPGPIASHPTSGLTPPPSPDPLTGQPIVPANSRQPSPRVFSAASHTAIPSLAAIADCLQHSKWRLRPAPDLPSGSDADQTIAPARPSISVPLPYHPHSVDSS